MPSSRLDVALRFELATEEGRALFVSYGVASALALAWLLVVQVMPVRADEPAVRPDEPIIVVPPPEDFPTPREVGGHSSAPSTRRASRGGAPGASSIRDAFGGTAGLVDAGRILRGVDLSRGSSAAGEAGVRKVGLGTGIASRTPGLSREGGVSPTGGGVGTVAGEGVSRSALTIAPPEVRPIADAPSAGAATEVGQSARAHVPQLERCYYAEGLSRNPALAGLVRLAISVEGGRVTTAEVVSRSWAGTGANETELCLVRVARGWRLGSSSAHIVLPLSFTSPTR